MFLFGTATEEKEMDHKPIEKEKEFEEANKDAEELEDVVRTKNEVVKSLQNILAEVQRMIIAELKAEVQTLYRSHTDKPQQQQQQRDFNCVSGTALRVSTSVRRTTRRQITNNQRTFLNTLENCQLTVGQQMTNGLSTNDS